VSVVLFVAWHPLQALVFGSQWAQTVLNPWFLAAVAAFGVASRGLTGRRPRLSPRWRCIGW
jgi:predicted Abi (CAAX) family protease